MKGIETAHFLRQVSALLGSGFPINKALEIFLKKSDKKTKSKISSAIRELEKGIKFSDAALLSGLLPKKFYGVIKTSEENAYLKEAMESTALFIEKKEEFVKSVRKSLFYPLFVLCLSFFSLIGVFLFVVPAFSGMFYDNKINLPATTKIIIAFSTYWWGIFFFIIPLFALIYAVSKDDRLLFEVPLLGDIFKKIFLSEFCFSLGYQLKNGMQILPSINNLKNSFGIKSLKQFFDSAHNDLKNGKSLFSIFSANNFFDGYFCSMVSFGESSGRLDKMFFDLGEYYVKEVDHSLKGFLVVFEPVLTLFVGCVVGFVAFSMIMPLFCMINSLL